MGTILDEIVAGATSEESETVNEPEVIDEPEIEQGTEESEQGTEEIPEETAQDESRPEDEGYKPNHKYSFMDEEFEFDDKVKSVIKSKEDEDYFRDVFTAQKAHAAYKEFGGVREIGDKLKNYENVDSSFKNLNAEISQVEGMLRAGNIEQFREYLGIPKEKLLDWAVSEAQAQQDPSVAAQLQQQYMQQAQTFNLQNEHNMMQNKIEQQMADQYNRDLEMGLEGSNVAKAYDDLVGTQGSFRQAVINHGLAEHQIHSRNISVGEAIKAVEAQFGGLVANQSVGTQQSPQPQVQTQVNNDPQQTVVINQGNQETIPNLRAGSQTPAKKQIRSLADLKKYAKTLED